MKLTFFLMFLFTCQLFSSTSYSQTTRLSVNLQNVTVKEVLTEIEDNTEFFFLYSKKLIDVDRKVTINSTGKTISEILDELFNDQDIKYVIDDRQIILSPLKPTDGKNKNNYQQELVVTGKVTNMDGEGLPGVNIVEKGTTNGTVTDLEGNYKLEVSAPDAILVFSYIGFLPEEIPVEGRNKIEIRLAEDITILNEVVVIGYGTQNRKNVTGAISKVDLENMEETPNTNLGQALRGKVAGVQFTDNGRPGQEGSILIRGRSSITASNDPLIILDGVTFFGNISDINPNDIASMEILKDASASAIYGARAANGVILITSKIGKSDKPTISFNTYYAIQDYSNKLKLLSPNRYIDKTLDYLRQKNLPVSEDPVDIANYLSMPESENYLNNNTIDPWEVISQESSIQSNDINISGKTNSTKYFFSGAYVNEKGLVFNDNSKRLSLRANLETEINDWVKVGLKSMYSHRDNSGIPASVSAAMRLSPYAQLYVDSMETDLKVFPVDDQVVSNPLFNAKHLENKDISQNLFANIYGIIEIPFIEGLSYQINVSPNIRFTNYYIFDPKYDQQGHKRVGETSKRINFYNNWVLENILKYQKDIGIHNFGITLLYGRDHYNMERNIMEASDFFNDLNGWDNMVIGQTLNLGTYAEEIDGISSMLRLNYRLLDRYMVTITGRKDGSSVFGAQNKFGLFPSLGLSWVLSDESFIKDIASINYLKARFSYGKTGNQAIKPYQSLDRTLNTKYVFGDGSPTYNGIYPDPTTMPNASLRWESSTSTNIGLEFGLFNNKIFGVLDLYDTQTDDLLLNRSLPVMTGFEAILSNIGETRNRGMELSLSASIIQNSKFSWNGSLVFSYNRNEIIHLTSGDADGDGIEDDDIASEWFIGQPIEVEYDYVFDGIYQEGDDLPNGYEPGFVKVKDLDGDGEITPSGDRKVIGNKEPLYRWGLTNEVRFGNLSLSVFVNAMQGWIATSTFIAPYANFPGRPANLYDRGWWTTENKSNENPSLVYNNPLGMDLYESRDFIRVQDVSLSYQFNKDVLSKLNINNLRVYISGRNLWTFTKWPGFDPEPTVATDVGLLKSNYPTPRTISIGLSTNF